MSIMLCLWCAVIGKNVEFWVGKILFESKLCHLPSSATYFFNKLKKYLIFTLALANLPLRVAVDANQTNRHFFIYNSQDKEAT